MKKRILLIAVLMFVIGLAVLLIFLNLNDNGDVDSPSTEGNGATNTLPGSNISVTNERPWLTEPEVTEDFPISPTRESVVATSEPGSLVEKLAKPECKLYLLALKGKECWLAYTLRGPVEGDVSQYNEDPVLYYGGKALSESSLQIVDSYTGVVCRMGAHPFAKLNDVCASDIKLWVVHVKANANINQNLFVLSVPDFGEGKDVVSISTNYTAITSESLYYTHGDVALVQIDNGLVLLDIQNISVEVSGNIVSLKVPIKTINNKPGSVYEQGSLSFHLLKSLNRDLDDSGHILLDNVETPVGAGYDLSVTNDYVTFTYTFAGAVDSDFVAILNSCYLHVKTDTSSLSINIFRE